MIAFATKDEKNYIVKILITLLILPLMWETLPKFGETIIWPCGAINYLLPTVFLIFYIKLIGIFFNSDKKLSKCKIILFCMFGCIISSLHEIVGIILCSYLGLTFLYLSFKNKKINFPLLIICIFAIIGLFTIILSPGTRY